MQTLKFLSFFLAILAIFQVSAQCSNMTNIVTWQNMNGVNYINRPKNQDMTSMCWDFSTTSFLEAAWYKLTNNSMVLSVEQTGDNIKRFYTNEYYNDELFQMCRDAVLKNPDPKFKGYAQVCALYYVSKKGVMTDYEYPFTGGLETHNNYDLSQVTPIGVREIQMLDNITMEKLTMILKTSPILASLEADSSCVISELKTTYNVNHGVLLTGLKTCLDDGETYLQYLNSWGPMCENGLFYIRITDKGTLISNRGILDTLVYANVYSKYADGSAYTIADDMIKRLRTNTNNNLLIKANLALTTLIFIIVVFVLMTKCIQCYVQKCKKQPAGNSYLNMSVNETKV